MTDTEQKKNILTVDVNSAGQRLDNFILKLDRAMPRSLAYKLCRTGQVRVNGSRSKPPLKLKEGDLVRVPPSLINASKDPTAIRKPIQFEVVHDDSDYLIINKPSGLAVHSGSHVKVGVIDHLRASMPEGTYIELAHRLDRDTSGCLVLAKSRDALLHFQSQQQEGKLKKYYLALLKGTAEESKWHVKEHLAKVSIGGERKVIVQDDGQSAHSIFHVMEQSQGYFLARIEIPTGRTHQIRVHSAWSGHPVAGDSKYGDAGFNVFLKKKGLKRLFLHAAELHLSNTNGEDIIAHAHLPEALSSFS